MAEKTYRAPPRHLRVVSRFDMSSRGSLAPAPLTGKTISRYRVLERLGESSTAAVYKGEDLVLGRPVALKFLLAGVS